MKNKVMLFDASGVPVGETFMRRARQLVNQQRAEWINDNAIRFAPDADVGEAEWATDFAEEPKAILADVKESGSEALLYYIAERRISERKKFILHSILMLPVYLILLLMAAAVGRNGQYFLLTTWSAWTTPYMLHAFVFIRERLKEYRPEDRERQLEREVDKLRRVMK